MFDRLLERQLGIDYLDRILIKDYEGILKKYNKKFRDKYRQIIYEYYDVEKFRYIYETKIKNSNGKHIVIVQDEIYIPYDIQKDFTVIELSYNKLFPKLNTFILKNSSGLDFDLLSIAYENLYENLLLESETKEFISKSIYEKTNVEEYVLEIKEEVENIVQEDIGYNNWFEISSKKATIRNLELISDFKYSSKQLEELISNNFKSFVLDRYKGLSGRNAANAPILLSKTMDFILMKQKKFALIVMDGMSVADWQIISREFQDIVYEVNYSFALIPTLTSISRQSLFSGKLPIEIENLFSLAKEKSLFIEKCKEYGYKQDQIRYHRGYDIDLSIKDKCIGIVINDIDDLVHNQLQGYNGMYRDIEYLAKEKQVQKLIKKLYDSEFEIYITSDHGNTKANGIGKVRGAGIEVETKSQRVVIYKDFASEEDVKKEFNLIEYPGYYLPKDNKYLICEDGEAFALKGEEIVSHGGISIDEVIVPFITIKGVKHE
ncbi:BREX-3 system phosphatase PglZ [Clostridium algidicarnis]|uniref:BREX-3 system phosphatase PglZ n=1 Tax=Clostridium algidicarnis TaxID=37659 RepID=UPI001CF19B69|nr:BREX-3 system phosphatase PglZ [Clostridium algidicarnis]MCB2286899.1 BREX-3 system phosphatase PglZ [Clostridium algidicarnis]